jgi:hypothetical protein
MHDMSPDLAAMIGTAAVFVGVLIVVTAGGLDRVLECLHSPRSEPCSDIGPSSCWRICRRLPRRQPHSPSACAREEAALVWRPRSAISHWGGDGAVRNPETEMLRAIRFA